jgi:hypothetical protein
MAENGKITSRTDWFVLTSQLQGLVQGLSSCTATQVETSEITAKLFLKLYRDFVNHVSGSCVANLPEPDGNECVADMLVYASIMHATLIAFLSPDEVEEQNRAFGFGHR